MWVCVASTKRFASALCCWGGGFARIGAGALAAFCSAGADPACDAGAGIAATAGTAGGGALCVWPIVPLSTATSTATPTAATASASSHAPRSDGGAGGCA
jgi:hypothetical protein